MASARDAEAGFTIIEVLIAAAIFTVALLIVLEQVRTAQALTVRAATVHAATLQLQTLTDRMRAEAVSAETIELTADEHRGGACTEVQFYQPLPRGSGNFWTYRHMANATTIERYASGAPIAPCVDPGVASTTAAANITAVTATATSATDAAGLAAHVDPISGSADTPFVVANISPDVVVDTHVTDWDAPATLHGGNGYVELEIDGSASTVVDLAPGIRPNGFDLVLQYPCNGRCGAGENYAPLAQTDVDDCANLTPAGAFDPSAIAPVQTTVADCSLNPPPGHPVNAGAPCTYITAYAVGGYYEFHYSGAHPPADRIIRFTVPSWSGPPSAPVFDRYDAWTPGAVPATVAAYAIPATFVPIDREQNQTIIAQAIADCANLAAEAGALYATP